MPNKNISCREENVFLNKFFKRAYIVYAFWFILSPIIETFTAFLNCEFDLLVQFLMIVLVCFLTKVSELGFNYRKLKFKKLKSLNRLSYFLRWAVIYLPKWLKICIIKTVVQDAQKK